MKIEHIFLGIVFVLSCFVGYGWWSSYNERKALESKVLELREELSGVKPEKIYIHDSIEVEKVLVKEVDKTDYKKMYADRELIKELKIKLSQVVAENQTLVSTIDSVRMSKVSDSVYSYKDKWASFEFNTVNNNLSYSVRDSISMIISKEYKHRFLFFRWGTKGYNVFVMSHNPRASVDYSRFIKVSK